MQLKPKNTSGTAGLGWEFGAGGVEVDDAIAPQQPLGRRAADAVAFMRAVVRKHSSRLLERGNTSARTREGAATEERKRVLPLSSHEVR